MKISRNWLNKYIISNNSDSELVDRFTQLGLECTFRKVNSIDSNIIVGKVVNCIKHPNADRLKVCEVDLSNNKLLTIICGAPNVTKNILVPVAKIGSEVGDFKIKKTKIRGVTSNGMICSEKELGLGDNHEGIMILDAKFKKGHPLKEFLSIEEDTVFDFDITPNRGDCLSHVGIARELAIIEKSKSKIEIYAQKKLKVKENNEKLTINILDNKKCNRYAACIIRDVIVKDSPDWLKRNLESIGQKSINNVVDAANFILMDLGHPMHTFDLGKIKSNKINVRAAKKNESIITLDDCKQKLNSNNLLICDGNNPIAIAGIIGGNNSGVDGNTKDILIESAYFNAVNIRKSSKSLGLSTEASRRFERDTDINMLIPALNKLALLIQNVAGGEISSKFFDIYDKEFKGFNDDGLLDSELFRKIPFNIDKCNNFLGIDLKEKDVINIFDKLSIKVKNDNNHYKCIIPSYRNDLERDVDLYEEIARVYGYDKIPSNLNFNFPSNCFVVDENLIEDRLRTILSNNGFNEHYSNSLYSEEFVSLSNNEPIRIKNPLSQDMMFLRNSLSPGILKALSYNEKRDNVFLKYFEIGSINEHSKKTYNSSKEKRMLCLGYLGNNTMSWKNKNSFDIYDVKGDITMLINNIGLDPISYKIENIDNISIILQNDNIGSIYNLDNKVKNKFKFDNNVILCDIDIDKLSSKLKNREIQYNSIIPFPSIKRDLAILVSNNIKHEQIIENIYKSASNILKEIKLFDIYLDESLGDKSKSLAYSLKFQSNKRTLKVEDVDKEINLILKDLKNNLNAVQR